ncbi:hypothetical protein SISNIDRAFT_449851 [Sistotremastrum niveocremeum HHB9708]|uniref:Uncharacterized protein n=2 Tax=Sistotremastraceae TaxID=3402574 RepID=A0A164YPU5_9AGAM|nr:hypothetical protein SISNIDRAFT_449851 [Sistotremastrum niveocremeum HHB9708]KZT41636.1 hypothetical protein SISSUDRAFT_1042757 [Sistotremastrum suecicum HHB10207 ss-3]
MYRRRKKILPPHAISSGPSNAAEATPCACSYEVYNAYSACAACQSQDNHNDTVTENWVT